MSIDSKSSRDSKTSTLTRTSTRSTRSTISTRTTQGSSIVSSISSSRSRRNQKYEITVPNPENGRKTNLRLTIPSYLDCNSGKKKTKIFCGKKSPIPPGYSRRGNQYECLKKGFGAGMCSIYKKN